MLMEEILHQLIGSLSHYLQGFIHPRFYTSHIRIRSLIHIYVVHYLTWPMAKRLKLFGITYLVGKIKFKLLFQGFHSLNEL